MVYFGEDKIAFWMLKQYAHRLDLEQQAERRKEYAKLKKQRGKANFKFDDRFGEVPEKNTIEYFDRMIMEKVSKDCYQEGETIRPNKEQLAGIYASFGSKAPENGDKNRKIKPYSCVDNTVDIEELIKSQVNKDQDAIQVPLEPKEQLNFKKMKTPFDDDD